ncbi:MAG: sulfite exporter TauE/SafE family protein [Actinomycetia bacterium]|nr:sulfite exporter TauE/SafE family protein [Actinomycetes bacterium]
MPSLDLLFACAAAAAVGGVIQGTAGYGVGLLLLPILAIIASSHLPQVILILGLPAVVWLAVKERGNVDSVTVGWLLLGRLAGTAGGVALLVVLAPHLLEVLFGVGTLAAVAAVPLGRLDFAVTRIQKLAAGTVSGLMGTTTGVGGPPVALLFVRRSGAEIRGTVSAVQAVGAAVSLGAVALTGRITVEDLALAGLLFAPMCVGLWLSRILVRRINATVVRAITLAAAGMSGAFIIVQGLV